MQCAIRLAEFRVQLQGVVWGVDELDACAKIYDNWVIDLRLGKYGESFPERRVGYVLDLIGEMGHRGSFVEIAMTHHGDGIGYIVLST